MTVAVIGGGVVGLTTGVLLLQSGSQVRLYATALAEGTASAAACAMWLPFLMGDENSKGPEIAALNESRRWADVAWTYFEQLSHDQESGVRASRWHELLESATSRPYYSDVVADFEEGEFRDGLDHVGHSWEFDTFIIEMPKYLPWLRNRFVGLGGEVIIGEILDFTDVGESVVFNCSGLGASKLSKDSSLRPIKGQLLLHAPVKLGAAFGAGEFCIIPREDALAIGSLFITDEDSLHEDANGSKWLWDMACAWERTPLARQIGLRGSLGSDQPQEVVVGVRPFRGAGARVQRESRRSQVIYHDYGHGGSGVTFSWGCATCSLDEYRWNVSRELRATRASRPASTCDVSIEVGHFEIGDLSEDEWARADLAIGESMLRARRIKDVLVASRQTYSLCVLVDDKRVDVGARQQLLAELLTRLTGSGIDYVCLESSLADSLRAVREILPNYIARRFDSHLEKFGFLSCAQDIVIWYCLRLGLIDRELCKIVPISQGASSSVRPLESSSAISILSAVFEKPERAALRLLRRGLGPEIASVCSPIFLDVEECGG